MRIAIRVLAVLAAVSVLGTLWFIAVFGARGGLGPLIRSGSLGILTIAGWVVALVAGPVAAVQLWRFRESGRRAGIILFGSGLFYYVVGLFAFRAPGASVSQILATAAIFGVPLLVLISHRAKAYVGREGSHDPGRVQAG